MTDWLIDKKSAHSSSFFLRIGVRKWWKVWLLLLLWQFLCMSSFCCAALRTKVAVLILVDVAFMRSWCRHQEVSLCYFHNRGGGWIGCLACVECLFGEKDGIVGVLPTVTYLKGQSPNAIEYVLLFCGVRRVACFGYALDLNLIDWIYAITKEEAAAEIDATHGQSVNAIMSIILC